jgi:deoxyribonuclease (pyrimidine dimer)
MIRINLFKPADLVDQHLVDEWCSIIRIPLALRYNLSKYDVDYILERIPHTFSGNSGHVTFFFDKMRFLISRYESLAQELKCRNIKVKVKDPYKIFTADIPYDFCRTEWSPTVNETISSFARIEKSLRHHPGWLKINGIRISYDELADQYARHLDSMHEVA